MLTDLEIAQQAKILEIKEIAKKVNLTEDDLELYGKYKAKINEEAFSRLKDKEDGRYRLLPQAKAHRPSRLRQYRP